MPMILRASKALLVLFAGLFALLVGIDNILDYGTNFDFVRHVMAMDTTFPNNRLLWRAITSETVHHVAYAFIIGTELLTGVLCTAGAIRLFRARHAPAAVFNAEKTLAASGLVCGFALWFFGFLAGGGEWFQMWQSQTWNGQEAAFRFAALFALVLIYLSLEDRGHDGGG